MPCLPNCHHVPFLVTLLGATLATLPVQAQSITSADTATTIQQTGNQYQIDGGNLSGDSTNLFHSFGQFGLLTGESVLFSNPATVENIIGRITGGDASIIDGLLAVDGDANLYLLNPAGIFFGENTQLNLGGSFSASTATGLNFGEQLLDALGSNDYAALNGTPTGYEFASETGALINTGDLAVTSGESLTLLGGQVINTGQLSAANGEVLVMAVPGENRVRLSQNGSLLGLELETLPGAMPTSAFTATTVPALLTGAGALGMATDITVNPDGTVSLSGSSLQIPTDAGTAIVSGQLEADSGNIGILGEQIALVGATVDASGDTGGGTVLIGGDELGNGSVPNAAATIIDENSVVQADARDIGNGGKIVAWGTDLLRSAGQLFARGGTNGGNGGFIETSSLGQLEVSTPPDVSALNGDGGLWLLDPANIRIVRGNGTTNISSANPFVVGGDATDAMLGVRLLEDALQGGANVEIRTTGTTPGDGDITLETALLKDDTDNSSLSFIAAGNINLLDRILSNDLVNLTLTANGAIVVGQNIRLQGDGSGSIGNLSITSATGNIDLAANFIEVAGALSVNADDSITAANSTHASSDIAITSNQGSATLGNLKTIAINDSPGNGNVVVTVNDDITITESLSTGLGAISLTSTNGSVAVSSGGFVSSRGSDTDPSIAAGDITLQATNGVINLDGVVVTGGPGLVKKAGNITASAGSIVVGGVPLDDNVIFLDNTVRDGIHLHTLGVPIIDSQSGSLIGQVTGLAEKNIIGQLSSPVSSLGEIEVDSTTFEAFSGPTVIGLADSLPNFTDLKLVQPLSLQLTVGQALPITVSRPQATLQVEQRPDNTEPEIPPEVEDLAALCISDCEQANSSARGGSRNLVGTPNVLPVPEIALQTFEQRLTTEYSDHLGLGDDDSGSGTQITGAESVDAAELPAAQARLRQVQGQTGKRPALIYAVFGNAAADTSNVLQSNEPSDPLELLLVTADGEPKYIQLPATRGEIMDLAHRFRRQITSPSRVGTQTYLPVAQKLYQLLIAPLEEELAAQGVDTISFITDAGLRSLPIAALHDGENFLVENYNVGLMPSLSLTDLTHRDINNVSALVAGTSVFADQIPLPGVPVELDAISSQWSSSLLQGDTFSLDKLQGERQQNPYGIIHLATHGEFNAGDLSKSYLHLHNEKLGLDQLRNIGLHKPAVELITLSACQTALGSRTAELGFAGFAVLAGAKTAVASLWSVSDEASAGLMIEFYQQLQNQPVIKAEALRRAQLAMLRGEISVEGDRLKLLGSHHQLPAELALEDDGTQDFSHPYYWAAFTMIGSPW